MRRFLSFVIVLVAVGLQMILIPLGWSVVLDFLAGHLAEHTDLVSGKFVRGLGVPLGVICVLYPVYFGLFDVGLRTRRARGDGAKP